MQENIGQIKISKEGDLLRFIDASLLGFPHELSRHKVAAMFVP